MTPDSNQELECGSTVCGLSCGLTGWMPSHAVERTESCYENESTVFTINTQIINSNKYFTGCTLPSWFHEQPLDSKYLKDYSQ